MTAFYGTNYLLANTPAPATYLESEKWGGHVRALVEHFTGSIVSSGDTIYVGKLPKGALPIVSYVRYNGSDTGIISLGYSGDADALGQATALTTTKTQTLIPTAAQMNTPLTADRNIYATYGSSGAHAMASADTLDVAILFTKE